ncbi:MAG: sigma-70 family RNA polymerase sigma factor [Chloroflexi bacterium]|nr:MAG: sigma-70 family RNA polymerase sigma factor [Chloroflexota bacterium]
MLGNPEPDRPAEPAPAIYPNWEAVYQDNVVGIYQLVFRRVGNAADAEDLAAEALMQTLKTLRLPAPVPTVRAYLVKTARTVLADHWRRHYAARDAANELEQMPVEIAANPNAVERAQRLLALLPDHFRNILELRFLRGYSVREAANELGVSESNARVLQFRALRKAADLEREVLR